jgi:membrane dipeptidase
MSMPQKELATGRKAADSLVEKSFFVNVLDPANVLFPDGYVDELYKARVGAENITVAAPWDDTKRSMEKFSQWFALIRKHADKLHLVESISDIEEARSRGKVGIILGLQGASAIGDDLDLLLAFHKLGLRILGIVYQRRNIFADGCGEPKDSGLSELGKRLVEAANRLGIVIDLSHVGRKATLEIAELSKDPVIFSHSNVKALCNHIRNADDEQIKAVAEKGGLIGIVAYGPLLTRDRRSSLKDMIDNVDYVVKLVGVDHVGFGLDCYPASAGVPKEFDEEFRRHFPEIAGGYPFNDTPEGINGPTEWRVFVKELVERGYSDDDVEKILGQNALRVFKKVWK